MVCGGVGTPRECTIREYNEESNNANRQRKHWQAPRNTHKFVAKKKQEILKYVQHITISH
jgi:hypothetical protein